MNGPTPDTVRGIIVQDANGSPMIVSRADEKPGYIIDHPRAAGANDDRFTLTITDGEARGLTWALQALRDPPVQIAQPNGAHWANGLDLCR